MTAHLFGALGMMPFNIPTDPALPVYLQRVAKEIPGIEVHGPFRDYQVNDMAAIADDLPAEDLLFYTGVSLSANNATVFATRTHHIVDGLLCFQASDYGSKWPVPGNVKFAMLFNSDVPIPLPGLGAYRWIRSENMHGGLINMPHQIPHPGDYDDKDQETFIQIMKRIIANPQR